MKKQVGTKKYVLLSLNYYNDLLSLKRSSAVNIEEQQQQQQQLPSQSEQAKIEILGTSPSSHSNSEAIAKLSVSSQLVNNKNKDFSSCNATTDQTSLPENKFLPDKVVDKVLDTLLASGMSSGKIERTKRILNIRSQKDFTLDRESGIIQGKYNKKSSNLLDFLIDIQSPNKKLTKDDLELISQLQLLPHLVANTFAKRVASNTPHGQGQQQQDQPNTTSTPTWLSIF